MTANGVRVAPMLTVQQIADHLNVSREEVLGKFIASGELAAINIGGEGTGKRYRIRPADLDRFLESRRYAA